jgi:hypothetical protein
MPVFPLFDKPLAVVCVGAEVDDCVVAVKLEDLRVAEGNNFRSELCHHTGIPSPYIVKLVNVVVYGVFECVHELSALR